MKCHCDEVERLRAEVERLRDALDRERLSQDYQPDGVDIVMGKLQDARRERDEAREQHSRLVEAVKGLADEWTEASQREQEFADRYQGYYLGVVGTRRNCRDHLLATLADVTPAVQGDTGDAPPAEQEAGEIYDISPGAFVEVGPALPDGQEAGE